MIKYVFYDTDVTGNADYDIRGKDYKELIMTCCTYCKTVSFLMTNSDTAFLNSFEKYRIFPGDNIQNIYNHYASRLGAEEFPYVGYYKICPELQALLLNIADSLYELIYGWGYKNPEDPAFYREDGSVFFSSTIHEGECELMPKKEERIEHIVSKEHWICQKI